MSDVPAGAARLRHCFASAHASGRAALITYHTFGYPTAAVSLECALAAARAGADIIELGVPFSDPSADGPVIVAAMEQALAAGASLHGALAGAAAIAKASPQTGIVLFGYYNPIWIMGPSVFASACRDARVDAVLVVDVPLEELDEISRPLAAHGVGSVPLLAPTSGLDRAAMVASRNAAFTYYISMAGVTGAAAVPVSPARIADLRAATNGPVAVGFGIKTPSDVAALAPHADGVVVGSRLVAEIGAGAPATAAARTGDLVAALAAATRRT